MCEFRYARRHHECFPYDDGNEHFQRHDKPNANAGGNTFRTVFSGVFICLRITTHIAVRVLTRPIPLHGILREEHPGHLVIIARAIVIQPGQAVVVLPGEALGGVDRPLVIAEVAVGSEHLVALDRGGAAVGTAGDASGTTKSFVELEKQEKRGNLCWKS